MFRKTTPKDAAKDAQSRKPLPSGLAHPRASRDRRHRRGLVGRVRWRRRRQSVHPACLPRRPRNLEVGDGAHRWQPQHLVAETADGDIIGVAPCYLKSHSRGEYVFDRGWGGSLRARRRQLLSEASGHGAVHARNRPPPHGGAGRRRRHHASGARRGLIELARLSRCLLGPLTFMTRRNGTRLANAASSCAPTSNSIGTMPAFATFADSSPPCRRASARPSGASAATRLALASRWCG